jgi:hypothetical protein
MSRLVADREAHLFATAVHEELIARFYENPSEQLHWHTDLYEGVWEKYSLPSTDLFREWKDNANREYLLGIDESRMRSRAKDILEKRLQRRS